MKAGYSQFENIIIYLIGYAGVGKYTIAKELSSRIGARIVDNHLINNPIFSLIYTDGVTPLPQAVWDKVAQIRQAVFTTIEEISPKNWSFIFTNELLENNPKDVAIFNQVHAIAQKRKSIFIPIRLVCELDELCERVSNLDRIIRYKDISCQNAIEKFQNYPLFMPSHPATITLDVTNLTASENAQKIIKYMLKKD